LLRNFPPPHAFELTIFQLHFIDFISWGVLDNGPLYCITLWFTPPNNKSPYALTPSEDPRSDYIYELKNSARNSKSSNCPTDYQS
jgi:hypothetical protein